MSRTIHNLHPDEQAIVDALKRGSQEELGLLFDKYAPPLLNLILRITEDREQSEAVLQEVFIEIWQRIRTYDPSRTTLFVWMVGIARNKAMKALHASMRTQNTEMSVTESPEMILELMFVRGLSCQQVADRLNVSPESVMKQLRTALRHPKDNRQ